MRSIVSWSLKLRFAVVAAAVALVIVGFAKMGDTPTNLFPEFSPTIVKIQTEALGLSAAQVEQLITVPLEADLLNGVAWLLPLFVLPTLYLALAVGAAAEEDFDGLQEGALHA